MTTGQPATGRAATEVNFYHLTRSSLEDTLARLLTKTLQAGERAVVMLGSPERVDALNTHLWTFDPDGFLPHGAARDGEAARQPVWLTHVDENPNGASFLFVADRARSERVASYKRCFELFDGRDETAVEDARARWKDYRAAGHTVAYWQQTDGGGWEKKA
ncbi:MAG: DNA polymerase III subunit chi [Reyranella sp.]|nr:DNA polymerase III subunit chi [Reyranella sp.]